MLYFGNLVHLESFITLLYTPIAQLVVQKNLKVLQREEFHLIII